MVNLLLAFLSILAGIILAEAAYLFLLIIELCMLDHFNFELLAAWHYLKVGGVGGAFLA
ncbi:hypothetical protein [Aeromonas jandaei]|uniref:hypothetical protein n=1 Tax=Aeromonas jandaei TaxID=650 RepID=UPI001C040F16|nr:hypothetical protein [Aeromonas jandaei]